MANKKHQVIVKSKGGRKKSGRKWRRQSKQRLKREYRRA